MTTSFSRRDALRWAGAAAMATTFLPGNGRHRAWSHPAKSEGKKLVTRVLGRTGREVTTFGLAGGNKVMWDLPGDEGVEIVVKAVRAGMTYLETANIYQLSQLNYGKAFRILNLIPGESGYDSGLRNRLFIASKSMLRYAAIRDGSPRMGSSDGDGKTCIDDLKRTMTQMFGDGKGHIPEGAYVDLMQIHALTHEAEVDAIYKGFDNPGDKSLPKIGAVAGLVDYRDGTNHTGLNPGHKKWIRHLGITGHENPTVHMAAMRRDTANNFETLLVAVNPNDRHYFCHQTNSLRVAKAKGMGLIGMKVFADGVMYGLERKYAGSPGQSVPTVGRKDKVHFEDFLRYTLSAPGMSTLIAGIGLSDKNNDPEGDQLVADLAACQAGEPLVGAERRHIEDRVAALHGTETNFFQRTSSGFVAPRNVRFGSAADSRAKLLWDTAFAGPDPIERYEIYRREERIASLPFAPQTSNESFSFVDKHAPDSHEGGVWYRVRAVDSAGNAADSVSVRLA